MYEETLRQFVLDTLKMMATHRPEDYVRQIALQYYHYNWITIADVMDIPNWYIVNEPEVPAVPEEEDSEPEEEPAAESEPESEPETESTPEVPAE